MGKHPKTQQWLRKAPNIRSFRTAILACTLGGLVAVLPGCSTKDTQPQPYTPQQVQDNGDMFDWGPAVKTQALQMIDHAQSVCDLDIYELSDSDILHALERAKKRGVDVRVVVDATEQHSQSVAVPELSKAGVPVASLHISRGISHIKMLVTDGQDGGALIGGMNFGSRSWNNNDGSIYIPHPNSSFTALFRFDWVRSQQQAAEAPHLQLPLVTDHAIQSVVLTAIQSAQHDIGMEAFDLSDYDVINALILASRRGIQVAVLLDPGQHLNNATSKKLRDAGVTVRFYRSYSGELMHAKMLDIDNGKTFVIGSANFSHQAYTYNHEGDVVFHNVSAFSKSFEKDLSVEISRGTDYPEKQKNG